MVDRRQIRICMVSIYPPRGALHGDIGGVASYTKNLISNVPTEVSATLLANKIEDNEKSYQEGNIRVLRCWNKGIFSYVQIFIALFRERSTIDLVHIQHEFFLFGGIATTLLFPLFLTIVKFSGKRIVVTFHGVISLTWINQKFFRDNGLGGSPFLAKIGLSILVRFIAKLSELIIVHEEFFREILVVEYKIESDKIKVVRHGVEERLLEVDKSEARRILKLDEKKKIFLLFGYLSPYKGIDLLIDTFDLLNKDYLLIIAGGIHPRLRKTKKYNEYLERLRNKATKCGNISITGFIPDSEVPLYFIASDLVIFPYSYPTSVGALWLAVAFERPFLLSVPLRKLVDDQKCTFNLDREEIAEKIKQLFSNINNYYELLNYARNLKTVRSWTKIADETSDIYRYLLHKKFNQK